MIKIFRNFERLAFHKVSFFEIIPNFHCYQRRHNISNNKKFLNNTKILKFLTLIMEGNIRISGRKFDEKVSKKLCTSGLKNDCVYSKVGMRTLSTTDDNVGDFSKGNHSIGTENSEKSKSSKMNDAGESSSPPEILPLVVKCMHFAALKHANQRRRDPEETPFINHPIGVANILVFEGGIKDVNVILAALLHDTVEDTETTFDEIEDHFGEKVKNIVVEVTDDKSLPKQERKHLQILHARDSSYEAKLVKLADKLYNLRDLQRVLPVGWTEIRRQEYYRWANQVVNNLRGTNKELESALDMLFRQEGIM